MHPADKITAHAAKYHEEPAAPAFHGFVHSPEDSAQEESWWLGSHPREQYKTLGLPRPERGGEYSASGYRT